MQTSKTVDENLRFKKCGRDAASTFAAPPGMESYCLSLHNAAGGGGFTRNPKMMMKQCAQPVARRQRMRLAADHRKPSECRNAFGIPMTAGAIFEKRTRVRISFLCFLVLSPALMFASEINAATPPSVTFAPELTTALVVVLTAIGTWLTVRTREQNKAEEKVAAVRVEMERTPPLGEYAEGRYATKKELGNVEARLSGEVGDLRKQIDANDKTLRNMIASNDVNAEKRAVGTHDRIDSMQRTSVKTNKAIGILIGIISVKYNINPKNIDTDEGGF